MSYGKLRGRIREVLGTQAKLAEVMNIDSATLSKKLNNISEWTVNEIQTACIALNIPISKVHEYFFSE